MFGNTIKTKSEAKKREKLLEIKSQLSGLRPKVNLESKQEKNVEEKDEIKVHLHIEIDLYIKIRLK